MAAETARVEWCFSRIASEKHDPETDPDNHQRHDNRQRCDLVRLHAQGAQDDPQQRGARAPTYVSGRHQMRFSLRA
jgi:hypothetical protein